MSKNYGTLCTDMFVLSIKRILVVEFRVQVEFGLFLVLVFWKRGGKYNMLQCGKRHLKCVLSVVIVAIQG